MAWNTNRRQRLPADWANIRKIVLERDGYACQINHVGCQMRATDVDHVVAGDNHSLDNLQAACSACHMKKTHAEAQEARRRRRALRFRPVERHPGER